MPKKDVPGSSRKGPIDTRSTDADGQQADEVTTHAERADRKRADTPNPDATRKRGETPGAFKDETAR